MLSSSNSFEICEQSSPSMSSISNCNDDAAFENFSEEQLFAMILDEVQVNSVCEQRDYKIYLTQLYYSFKYEWVDFEERDDNQLLEYFNFYKEANNTIKNLIKSFITYVNKKSDCLILECMDILEKDSATIKKQFKKFCDRHAINNNFLVRLIESERYGKQFQYYLRHYALQWLVQSKVNNKPAHMIGIFLSLRCFQNQTILQKITSYRK
ncbi:hypothetical protein ABPG74_017219 [Tetrahymena malaccensis]